MTRPLTDYFTRITGTGDLRYVLNTNHLDYLLPWILSSLRAGASHFLVNPQRLAWCLVLSRKITNICEFNEGIIHFENNEKY